MSHGASILLGLLTAACFAAGRGRWGGALSPWVVVLWLWGLPPWGLLGAVVVSLGVWFLWPQRSGRLFRRFPQPGDDGVVVSGVFPKSDRGAVRVGGWLFIAHAEESLKEGDLVKVDRLSAHHAWVSRRQNIP